MPFFLQRFPRSKDPRLASQRKDRIHEAPPTRVLEINEREHNLGTESDRPAASFTTAIYHDLTVVIRLHLLHSFLLVRRPPPTRPARRPAERTNASDTGPPAGRSIPFGLLNYNLPDHWAPVRWTRRVNQIPPLRPFPGNVSVER